jgi:hypothetical protein
LQQPLEETLGRRAFSPLLHENVQKNATLVDRAPHNAERLGCGRTPHPSATYLQDVVGAGAVRAKFYTLGPNALVAYNDAALRED